MDVEIELEAESVEELWISAVSVEDKPSATPDLVVVVGLVLLSVFEESVSLVSWLDNITEVTVVGSVLLSWSSVFLEEVSLEYVVVSDRVIDSPLCGQ